MSAREQILAVLILEILVKKVASTYGIAPSIDGGSVYRHVSEHDLLLQCRLPSRMDQQEASQGSRSGQAFLSSILLPFQNPQTFSTGDAISATGHL